MRVIAGQYKGQHLHSPTSPGTRPTTARVKEAWASSLLSLRSDLSGASVLDAFAGSGALGLELLSRGASHCLFCERQSAALNVLRQNIAQLKLTTRSATICKVDSLSPGLLTCLKGRPPLDIVILDPPYELEPGQVKRLLSTLARSGYLRNPSLVSYEHAVCLEADLDNMVLCSACSPAALHLASRRTYGMIQLDYYRVR